MRIKMYFTPWFSVNTHHTTPIHRVSEIHAFLTPNTFVPIMAKGLIAKPATKELCV